MIHPLALVHADCDVGEGSSVWQFASVIRGAKVGAGSSIGACAVVDGATIGAGCRIGHAAQVHPGVVLGDNVFVGPGAVLCNDAFPRAHRIGWEPELLATWATIHVGNGASIGANAVILPGVRLGVDSFVAAAAVCRQDVPAGHIFKRSGAICEINGAWAGKRMRRAA